MSADSSPSKDVQVVSLYTEFAAGRISRRDFMSRAAALGVAGAAAATVGSLATGTADCGRAARRPPWPRPGRFRSTSPSGATCG